LTRSARCRRSLTSRQRRDYVADLKAGVPEAVIAEWAQTLETYIAEYTAALLRHFKRRKGK